jgi:hypothetical protein
MPAYRILVSAADKIEKFTIDTIMENTADEADALDQLCKRLREAEDLVDRPKKPLVVKQPG